MNCEAVFRVCITKIFAVRMEIAVESISMIGNWLNSLLLEAVGPLIAVPYSLA